MLLKTDIQTESILVYPADEVGRTFLVMKIIGSSGVVVSLLHYSTLRVSLNGLLGLVLPGFTINTASGNLLGTYLR